MPPPHNALHDMIEVDEIFRESELPITPFTQLPFPDGKDIREKMQSTIEVLVVRLDPPTRVRIDAFTLTREVEEDVTVMDVNKRDPAEI